MSVIASAAVHRARGLKGREDTQCPPSTSELKNLGEFGEGEFFGECFEVRVDPLTEEFRCCPHPGWSPLRHVLPPDVEASLGQTTARP